MIELCLDQVHHGRTVADGTDVRQRSGDLHQVLLQRPAQSEQRVQGPVGSG